MKLLFKTLPPKINKIGPRIADNCITCHGSFCTALWYVVAENTILHQPTGE